MHTNLFSFSMVSVYIVAVVLKRLVDTGQLCPDSIRGFNKTIKKEKPQKHLMIRSFMIYQF